MLCLQTFIYSTSVQPTLKMEAMQSRWEVKYKQSAVREQRPSLREGVSVVRLQSGLDCNNIMISLHTPHFCDTAQLCFLLYQA